MVFVFDGVITICCGLAGDVGAILWLKFRQELSIRELCVLKKSERG